MSTHPMKTPSANQQEGAKRARVMYCNAADFRETKGTTDQPFECVEAASNYGHKLPVLIVPVSALPEMEEQMARAMYLDAVKTVPYKYPKWSEFSNVDTVRLVFVKHARAALRALGLSQTAIRKGTKRGKSK